MLVKYISPIIYAYSYQLEWNMFHLDYIYLITGSKYFFHQFNMNFFFFSTYNHNHNKNWVDVIFVFLISSI